MDVEWGYYQAAVRLLDRAIEHLDMGEYQEAQPLITRANKLTARLLEDQTTRQVKSLQGDHR